MCHHLESLACVIESVFIGGACFFLSYPVGHMVEHEADMSGFLYMVSVYVCVCHFGVPVSALACSHCQREV